MYRPSYYRHKSRDRNSPNLSRALSPNSSIIKQSPRPFIPSINLSPDLKSEYSEISEFLSRIEGQLRRISPSFSFNFYSITQLSQALYFFTEAVDYLLDEKSRSSSFFTDFGKNNEYLDDPNDRIRSEMRKVKETTKSLNRYEQLLMRKNEKIEQGLKEIDEERTRLKNLEDELNKAFYELDTQESLWNKNKMMEVEKIKAEKEEAEKKIVEAREFKERIEKKIDESTKFLKNEKESLMQLETCLNQAKESVLADQKRITQEKLDLEKEKWAIEQRQRKIEEDEVLINLKQDHLNQEKRNFEVERGKMGYYSDRSYKKTKTPLSEDLEKHGLYQVTVQSQDLESKNTELEEREKEIEQAYKELQEQMDNFNKELEERETVLDERELEIEKQKKDMKKRTETIKMIESSLMESKNEIKDLRTFTMPELEKQSEIIEALIQDLNSKKNEVESLVNALNQNIKLFRDSKIQLNEKNVSSGDEKFYVSDSDVKKITQELEEKLEKVRQKEVELETKTAETVKTAEFLKKTHKEFEEKKREHEAEIKKEKEKLKTQFLKLESAMKMLSTKEAEIYSFKRKLEEKSQILKIKEAELNVNFLTKQPYDSSVVDETIDS